MDTVRVLNEFVNTLSLVWDKVLKIAGKSLPVSRPDLKMYGSLITSALDNESIFADSMAEIVLLCQIFNLKGRTRTKLPSF